ncbi:MAG: penicillin-binding protein 2 [Capsulimonadales bacterium]|nr:penicillin-binding protein 2 [Capsulimonadales bacterium]
MSLFALFIVLILLALVARLWFLQIVQGEDLRERSLSDRSLEVRTPAPRGIILDTRGRPLVTNSAQFTIFVNPEELPKKKAERLLVFERLAKILGITPQRLQEVMKRNKVAASGPIPVEEGVDQATLARISESRLLLPGIEPDVEPVRKYPMGNLAAHALGYIGEISAKQLEDPKAKKRYIPGDLVGKSGLERQYDELLNGVKGTVTYDVDARGRRQNQRGTPLEPKPGATLHLALNADVQRAAEEGLKGKKGAAVAIDPRNGEVIALASAPTFDPNLLAHRPLKPWVYDTQIKPGEFHRAIQSMSPPGSTFKLVTSAALLANNTVDPRYDYAHCGGVMSLGRSAKRCHRAHGGVNLKDALAASCDIYYYQYTLKMGIDPLVTYGRRFGLGRKLGIDLPGEESGILPSPAWKRKWAPIFGNPDPRWYPGDTANVSIGQGDVAVTPLQMASVVAAVANGGTIFKPHLVRSATDSLTREVVFRSNPKVVSRLGIAPERLRGIAEGMRQCVAGSRGTGHSVNLAAVAVAGKTGSAERQSGAKKESHAWFVCYAPYENPTIAIAVFLQSEGQNYHGGTDAAPIARKMLAKHFGISERTVGGSGAVVD